MPVARLRRHVCSRAHVQALDLSPWSPKTGPHELHGIILDEWARLGAERSALGYPFSDVRIAADQVGRFAEFLTGSIYWKSDTGVHAVAGSSSWDNRTPAQSVELRVAVAGPVGHCATLVVGSTVSVPQRASTRQRLKGAFTRESIPPP